MKEFVKEFTEIIIFLLIDFFSEYNQIKLNSKSRDMTAFQISMGLLQQITLLQEITNSPAQFSCITRKILEYNIFHNCESYFDNMSVKDLKIKYDKKKIFSEIRYYIFKHLQQLNCTLVSIELAGAKISESKSQ